MIELDFVDSEELKLYKPVDPEVIELYDPVDLLMIDLHYLLNSKAIEMSNPVDPEGGGIFLKKIVIRRKQRFEYRM